MQDISIGEKYDNIAAWWQEHHLTSNYGVPQLDKALAYAQHFDTALDVGCGAGGRLISKIEARGFTVTGLDASSEMIKLAEQTHPKANFIHADIENWDTDETFDFICAWDCLFHLPLKAQEPVLTKLCQTLNKGGILFHSFGDAIGAHIDEWRGQNFPYSSIGIMQNIEVMNRNGLTPLHLELDQHPEKHVYSIAVKALR